MFKKQHWIIIGAFTAGVILSGRVRQLPVIGPHIPAV